MDWLLAGLLGGVTAAAVHIGVTRTKWYGRYCDWVAEVRERRRGGSSREG